MITVFIISLLFFFLFIALYYSKQSSPENKTEYVPEYVPLDDPAYCKYCGTLKAGEWDKTYNEATGQKNMLLTCPAQPCEHSGHLHFPTNNSFTTPCIRCGYKDAIHDMDPFF